MEYESDNGNFSFYVGPKVSLYREYYHRYNTYVTGLETRVNSILLRVALVIELQYTVQPGIPPGIPEPGLH